MRNLSKRLNYLVFLFLTSLMAFGGLLTAIPASVVAAPEEGGGVTTSKTGFEKLSVADQATTWSSYKTVLELCNLKGGAFSEQDLRDGKWFRNETAQIGHHVEPDDGKAECSNEKNWFGNLLTAAGFGGDMMAAASIIFEKRDGGYVKKANAEQLLVNMLNNRLFGGSPPRSAPNNVTYGILMANFTAPKACGAAPIQNASGTGDYKATKTIYIYDEVSKTSRPQLYGYPPKASDVEPGDVISVGPGLPVGGAADQEIACNTIANNLADAKYASAVKSCLDAATCAGVASNSTNTPSDDPNLQCGTMWNPLNWYLCPIIKGITGVVNGLDNAIIALLHIDTRIFDERAQPGSGYYTAWQSFRAIALGLLVVAAITMVIAQALGFNFLDAYTVKKILPRLIVAIIGISLSWEIMRFFVEFTNNLGFGIRSLIYYPFNQGLSGSSTLELGGGATVAVTLIAGAAITGLGIIGLLSFAITALLAVAIAFLVLIIRQLIIIVLILMAPIAIAAYILPNTNGVWKLWQDSFTKLLLMFPIIMAFLAVGRVMAMTATTGNTGTDLQFINQLVGFAAYFMPYFLIPLTFRFAGGAMRTLGGFTNDKGRGGFDRLRKFRQGQYQEHGGRKVADARTRTLQKQANFTSNLQGSASKYAALQAASTTKRGKIGRSIQRTALQGTAGVLGGYNVEAKMSAQRAQTAKELNDQIATGQDDEIRGLTVNKDWAAQQGALVEDADGNRSNGWMRINNDTGQREFKTLAGNMWVAESKVDAGYNRWGNDTFAQQAALSYEMRKAASIDETQSIAKNFKNVAQNPNGGGWKMSDYEAGGTWIGAAFENQNSHLEYKKTDWKTGDLSLSKYAGFVDEIYEKKGSYPLAQMGANTIKTVSDAHKEATNTVTRLQAHQANGNTLSAKEQADLQKAQTVQRKSAAVAETFMSRFGGGMAGDPNDAQSIAMAQQQQQVIQQQVIANQPQGQQGGVPIPAQRAPQQTYRTMSNGAASVNEQVRELAVQTGVYRPDLPTPRTDSDNPGPGRPSAPPANIPRQD